MSVVLTLAACISDS